MAKFHISQDGTPRACSAKIACPIGGQDEHYETADEARAAYENQHVGQTFETYKTLELSDPDNVIDEVYQPTWSGSNASTGEWATQSLESAKMYATDKEKAAVQALPASHRAPYWEGRMAYLEHDEAVAFAEDWRTYLDAQREAYYIDRSVPMPTSEDFEDALTNHRLAAGHTR